MTNFVRENKKIFFYGAVIILGTWLGTKFFGNDDNITLPKRSSARTFKKSSTPPEKFGPSSW